MSFNHSKFPYKTKNRNNQIIQQQRNILRYRRDMNTVAFPPPWQAGVDPYSSAIIWTYSDPKGHSYIEVRFYGETIELKGTDANNIAQYYFFPTYDFSEIIKGLLSFVA